MRLEVRAVFWLLVGVAVLLCFAALLLPLALFDDFCGWVERKFAECFGDW